ncbi:MAG: pantoate--beta-alanine ligase [Candidatus Omnitrophica bacterium]|nr:pantoate--beta-alanine ligase [Candidatus Omnitrophota bacterium]
MKIATTRAELQTFLRKARTRKASVGFVPTMGFLHRGHARLIRQARRENDVVVVSVFVNPLQFGPSEDYACYPRDCVRDRAICARSGASVLFWPKESAFLSRARVKQIRVTEFRNTLCAPFRPGHFDGVATIVLHFFELIRPDRAYFGLKDYQQYRVIEWLNQTHLGGRIRLCGVDTVRGKSGLALSSRNRYLTKAGKRLAPMLYRALQAACRRLRAGAAPSAAVRDSVGRLERSGFSVQYFEVADALTMKPSRRARRGSGGRIVAAAVFLGETRLIDNVLV